MTPPIKGFIRNSLLDWEGRIASVVFLAGCNFRCPWCHARHLVLGAPDFERIFFDPILEYLRRHADWVDGVVISGGEPTLYADLEDMIDVIRSLGLGVKLDTNGSRPEVLGRLIENGKLDYVAMDVKAPLDERYHKAAGCKVDLPAITRSIGLLIGGDVDYELRTTVCSNVLSEKDMGDMSESLAGAERWILQPFRPINCIDAAFLEIAAATPEELGRLARLVRRTGRCVVVRGSTE